MRWSRMANTGSPPWAAYVRWKPALKPSASADGVVTSSDPLRIGTWVLPAPIVLRRQAGDRITTDSRPTPCRGLLAHRVGRPAGRVRLRRPAAVAAGDTLQPGRAEPGSCPQRSGPRADQRSRAQPDRSAAWRDRGPE